MRLTAFALPGFLDMPSKTKYVLLSLLLGLFVFAAAGFLAGAYLGTGPKHPHALGPVIIGAIIAAYTAPIGAIVGLISALVIKNRTWKKMLLILGIAFVLMVAGSILYVRLLIA